MYIKIGPYDHWFRPARWLRDWIMWFYGFTRHTDLDDKPETYVKYEALIEWIRTLTIYSWCREIENWINDRTERHIRVRIDDYDIWGMDHTLSLIVLPMLKLLKQKKQGAPHVEDEDVPEHLRSTAAPALAEDEVNTGHVDKNWFLRWEWVLGEMIWTFEQLSKDGNDDQFFHYPNEADGNFDNCKFDKDGYTAHQTRIDRGTRLFGKYFRGLWD